MYALRLILLVLFTLILARAMSETSHYSYVALAATSWGECSAAILSRFAVVGVASCLPDGYPKTGRVDAGLDRLSTQSDLEDIRAQGRVIEHFIPQLKEDDSERLMIMQLLHPFNFSEYVSAVPISGHAKLQPGESVDAAVVGYGAAGGRAVRARRAWSVRLQPCGRLLCGQGAGAPTKHIPCSATTGADHGAPATVSRQLYALAAPQELCSGLYVPVIPHRNWLLYMVQHIEWAASDKQKKHLIHGRTDHECYSIGRKFRTAVSGEFPYVALVTTPRLDCSAAILSPLLVTTAAFCVPSTFPPEGYVAGGNKQYTTIRDVGDPAVQIRRMARVLEFDSQDDMAVIKLEDPFTFTTKLPIICNISWPDVDRRATALVVSFSTARVQLVTKVHLLPCKKDDKDRKLLCPTSHYNCTHETAAPVFVSGRLYGQMISHGSTTFIFAGYYRSWMRNCIKRLPDKSELLSLNQSAVLSGLSGRHELSIEDDTEC